MTAAPLHPADTAPSTDDELLRGLYAEHGPSLLQYARHLTDGDTGRAEDLVQETALRAWQHRKILLNNARSPKAWLYTVIRNLARDQYRAARARPREVGADTETAQPHHDDTESAINAWMIRELVAMLPPTQRDVVAALYFADRPVAEVARRLGVPAGTVKSRAFYARRALAALL